MQMGFPSLAEDTDFNSSAQQRRVTKSSPVSAPRNKAPDQVKLPLTEMFENYLLNESVMAGYGNLVAIYDLLPRFYGWKKRTDFGDGLCTEFTGSIKGNLFHVQMTAAAIQKRIRIKEESQCQPLEEAQEIIPISTRTRSETVLMYPGMREELVEDALRKFSVIGNGFVDGSQLRVRFTIRDLMQELARNGHTYSCNEIKEALEILNKAHLAIKYQVDGGVIEESSTYLPHLSFAHKRKVVDGNDVCIAQLHPLIVGGIRTNSFRMYSYDTSMAVSSSLARYLHKYLSFNWLNASPDHPYTLGLVEIMSATSRGLQPRMNDNTRFMEKALQELIDNGALTSYEKETIQAPKSKRIVDARYKVWPTNEFVSVIIKGHHQAKAGDAKKQRAVLTKGSSLSRSSGPRAAITS